MIALVKKLWSDESGQGLVEYALIIALVSIVAVLALTALGGTVKGVFETINTKMGGTAPAAAA